MKKKLSIFCFDASIIGQLRVVAQLYWGSVDMLEIIIIIIVISHDLGVQFCSCGFSRIFWFGAL